jgi:hypothetical protein
LLLLSSTLVLAGCPVGHQAPAARAQEAATDFNLDTRFGRIELAVERVAPDARESFLERRRAWGGIVRVADYEISALKMRGDADADVFVKVSWYRVDQGDLHLTTLKQTWHDFRGDWKLVGEDRIEGEGGLINDGPPPVVTPQAKSAHFPTIRLGASTEPPANPAPATIPPPETSAGDAN